MAAGPRRLRLVCLLRRAKGRNQIEFKYFPTLYGTTRHGVNTGRRASGDCPIRGLKNALILIKTYLLILSGANRTINVGSTTTYIYYFRFGHSFGWKWGFGSRDISQCHECHAVIVSRFFSKVFIFLDTARKRVIGLRLLCYYSVRKHTSFKLDDIKIEKCVETFIGSIIVPIFFYFIINRLSFRKNLNVQHFFFQPVAHRRGRFIARSAS